MLEQYRIRMHIKKKEEEGGLDNKGKPALPQGPRKPSFLERLQQKAEDARLAQVSSLERETKKKRKQARN